MEEYDVTKNVRYIHKYYVVIFFFSFEEFSDIRSPSLSMYLVLEFQPLLKICHNKHAILCEKKKTNNFNLKF
jgi:hypothetical protein